jgi:hypothetical protein
MIPTRAEIQDTTEFFHTHFRSADYGSTRVILEWMKQAAFEKLDAMPFQPGEVVEWVCNNEKVANSVMVTDVPPKNEKSFSGVVIKSMGSPGYRIGHHCDTWNTEHFTRKTK